MSTPPPPVSTKAPLKPQAPATTGIKRTIKAREAKEITPRIVMAAVEGFGKTSYVAFSEKPLILMARGEAGYDTLLSAGRVPSVPAEPVESWTDLMGWLDHIIANPVDIKTLGLDAIGGFERLCHEFVCDRDFKGDWGDKGFLSFHKGYGIASSEWIKMIQKLDQINAKGITVVLLSHTKVKTVPNPAGADYQKYASDVHETTWNVTARWADAVLFGTFFVDVKGRADAPKAGKATGGNERHVYTGENAVMPSKTRYGMDPLIVLPPDPALSWGTVWEQINRKAA